MEHNELLAGIIASSIVNSSMARPDPPAKPGDFMPSRNVEPEKPKRINRKQIAADVRAVMMSLVQNQNTPKPQNG